MPALTAKPITATPITARPLTAYGLGESTDVSRWYLHWGGVNERAEMSEWSASGFGDSISETIVAADPGNGDQYLWCSADGLFALYIANSTAALTLKYTDIDGSTARSIVGPAVVAGAVTPYTVALNADGVTLTVSGTDYDKANVPELGSVVYFSSDNTPANHFEGTYWDRRFTNATALQGVNAVQGNGVDLYGTIPTVTLTGDCEIEGWVRAAAWSNTRVLGKASNSRMYFAATGVYTNWTNGSGASWASALVNIATGQDFKFRLTRIGSILELFIDDVSKGTVSITTSDTFVIDKIVGADAHNFASILYNLKITDQSGAEDVVYEYDLSGDDGSDIPITIDGVASTAGTWQNYDSGVDQVALPKLSRHYEIKDGPGATHLADSNGADATGAELFNVGDSDWTRSKT